MPPGQALEALAGMGFTQGEAFKAFSFFGPEAPEILAENPYAFVITGNDQGIPFERAQEIAEELPQGAGPILSGSGSGDLCGAV